jgi:hypothetical protein
VQSRIGTMSAERLPESESESLEQRAQSAHQEARMVLPGIQALFGFQLIAAFNTRFHDLDGADRVIHLSALVLVALAIALIMTPAAYHRICEPGRTSLFFVRLASALVAAAMVPLLLGISLDIYVVTRMALPEEDLRLGVTLAAAAFAMFVSLWMAFPYWRRRNLHLRADMRRLGRGISP